MARAKLITVIVLIVLTVIIVLQNTASVDTKLLFFTVTMPRALLLFITTAIGFAVGVLATMSYLKRP